MSLDIWTQCAERFEPQRIAGPAWRAVESQHVTSTRKLVDSDDEQQVLEALIDTAKPPWPLGRRFIGLHYLLATPFRHPPLRYGSRFGTRRERGIFYCAEAQATVFAEKAYYVLLFLEGTDADIEPLTRPLTVFQVRISTKKGADLTRAPFDGFVEQMSSATSYRDSQALGTAMRDAGLAAFRFTSARDPDGWGESRADRAGVQQQEAGERRAVDLHRDPRPGRAQARAGGDAVADELRA